MMSQAYMTFLEAMGLASLTAYYLPLQWTTSARLLRMPPEVQPGLRGDGRKTPYELEGTGFWEVSSLLNS